MKLEIVETTVQLEEKRRTAAGADEERRHFLRHAGKFGLAGPAVALLVAAGGKPARAETVYTE